MRRCHVEHTDSSIDIDIVWRTIRRVSQGVCWPFFVLWPIRSPCFSRSLPEPYLEAGLKKAIPAIMDQLSGKVPGDLPRHGSHDFYRCFSPTQNSFFLLGRLMMTHEPLVLQLAMWKVPFQLLTGQWLVPGSDVVMWNLLPSQVHPKQSG